MDSPETTVLSICSGYAGIELGLHRVIPNLRCIGYVEIELFACANLVAKMEAGWLDAAPVWTNLKTFQAERFRGKVHGITGGYPCQPFSVAGKRAGEDDPRHLWPHIAAIVRAVEPVWCFFENVPGHLSLGFPAVYRSLRDMGYKVEAGLFTASECGAPHKRERLFILAYRERDGCEESEPARAAARPSGLRQPEPCGAVGNAPGNDQRRNPMPGTYGQGEQTGRSGSHVADAERPQRRSPAGRGDGIADRPERQGQAAGGAAQCGDVADGQRDGQPQSQGCIENERGWTFNGSQSECLADAAGQRVQGPIPAGPALAGGPTDEHGYVDRWPAGPGQPQYEWEEPRTTAVEHAAVRLSQRRRDKDDTESGRQGNADGQRPDGANQPDGAVGRAEEQTELSVGRATDGTPRGLDESSLRTDRLRLLGNGVVPAQVERAFRALWKEMHK